VIARFRRAVIAFFVGSPTLPYAISGYPWPGLSKLAEESGEVIQVLGKIVGTGGEVEHWDGTNLRDRVSEELGDLCAAIHFFVDKNNLDRDMIVAQYSRKRQLFEQWHNADPIKRDADRTSR